MECTSSNSKNNNLISLPQRSNVLLHQECYADLIKLVQENDIPAFIAAYNDRIRFLSQNLGMETVLHRAWFEVLQKEKGLRSIRFVSINNIRILYLLENGKAFLLLAFKEKSGHKNTEYKKFIDPALRRFNDKENMR